MESTIIYDAKGVPYVTERGRSLGVQIVYCYENARSGGGTYEDDGRRYPARVVYHEIQGYANAEAIRGHAYPPHVWYKPEQRILFATVPLSRSAFALYQDPNAPYRTNKARSLQVELEGFSDYVANEPEQWLNNIAEDVLIPFCQFVDTYWGQSIDIMNTPGPFVIPGSARTDAPQRFAPDYWATFNGTCAHAHIPMGDDHWDTGAMDLQRIAQHAAMLIGQLLVDNGYAQERPTTMPGYMLRLPDGTVFGVWDAVLIPICGPELTLFDGAGVKLVNISHQEFTALKDWKRVRTS